MVGLMFVVAALVFPGSALAWDLGKSSNGVVINRESSDTNTATVVVTVFYDYKGGASWVTSFTPSYTSSYQSQKWICNVDGTDADAIEIDLMPGYRLQMVQVAQGTTYRKFAVINEALKVSEVGTLPVPVYLSRDATVAVSAMPATINASIGSTLPVTLAGFAGAGSALRDLQVFLSLAASLCAGWLIAMGITEGHNA